MLPSVLRSALDIKKAIEMAPESLKPIGSCGTKADLFKKRHELDEYDEDEDMEEEKEEDKEEGKEGPQSGDSLFIKKLVEIYDIHGSDHYRGILSAPFSLTITHPGCEFSGEITMAASARCEEAPGEQAVAVDLITARIQKWFEAGTTSGYGDVRAQETKVDKSVRDAREIPASEFTVSPNLITEIEKSWGEHFIPGTVRVEPYKIHMYGPGGLFKSHKDTPEKDLIGTFLVGLGDTTNPKESGVFRVGRGAAYNHGLRADEGHWSHSTQIPGTKKAGSPRPTRLYETGPEAIPRAKMEKVLEDVRAPYGLLLEHKYCMGTTELSGLDNVLHVATKAVAQRKNAEVHFLPVLMKVTAEMYRYEDQKPKVSVETPVFPLTQAHVDALISSLNGPNAHYKPGYDCDLDYVGYYRRRGYPRRVDVPNQEKWLVELEDVPFFTLDFMRSTMVWQHEEEEGAEYTGNEARPSTEDSIYLSYAMVVLPKKEQNLEDTQLQK
ncbi:hypothetical protein A0H81_01675 [Grifola frondosa]|uniref:Uncharacterized protein n=1 Tax=Grifola frondosa TaxID=5627 RepID=A0A1C7MN14_GRIFR|nr:hypothetical protein A0H81_01675 [Grifola frondosa]